MATLSTTTTKEARAAKRREERDFKESVYGTIASYCREYKSIWDDEVVLAMLDLIPLDTAKGIDLSDHSSVQNADGTAEKAIDYLLAHNMLDAFIDELVKRFSQCKVYTLYYDVNELRKDMKRAHEHHLDLLKAKQDKKRKRCDDDSMESSSKRVSSTRVVL